MESAHKKKNCVGDKEPLAVNIGYIQLSSFSSILSEQKYKKSGPDQATVADSDIYCCSFKLKTKFAIKTS